MTNQEVYEALERGESRFVAKRSGRVYLIPSDQKELLLANDDDLLLIGWPEMLSPKMSLRRYRGRKWVWLSPKNIAIAPPAALTTKA
ncbi:hypothetical protein HFN98_24715 [Rhizobium laguerreae]|uniref:hypothetical protein n=1 Tax=Rhizobium laguerreae TaxID=1076926 RepID=UPI001C8FEE1A|nr:hypothetical protein [Rhizobium laguerreae]MBY3333797.1 hypothetical protein [Rhizobium laguerreae]